jgi:hypothetical protein
VKEERQANVAVNVHWSEAERLSRAAVRSESVFVVGYLPVHLGHRGIRLCDGPNRELPLALHEKLDEMAGLRRFIYPVDANDHHLHVFLQHVTGGTRPVGIFREVDGFDCVDRD